MKRNYKKGNQSIDIIYAESLNLMLNHHSFNYLKEAPCILFVTTEPFYEKFYDKFVTKLSENQSFHWYICPNNESINQLEMYQKLLAYIEEMRIPTHSLILGAGNHRIYHLCGFLKETSLYMEKFIYIPTTVTGFMDALTGDSYLFNSSFNISSQQYVLPDSLVYDTMLNELESQKTWIEDFFSLIKLGLTSNLELFQMMTRISPQNRKASFSPYLELVIEAKEQDDCGVFLFLMAFTKSFYHLTESHYLSLLQKEHIGFLLYLSWSVNQGHLNFDFNQFTGWYEQIIKEELSLPKQMNTYDLAESIVKELDRFSEILGLEKIWKSNYVPRPTLEEMYQVIESYKLIKR